MTLYQIVSILKQIALTQPNVKSATDGSVYEVMNTNPSVKYNVVHLSQTKHISDEETDTYGFNIFYISRLEDSLEDNRLQIQSIGKEILDNILRSFCENWNIDFPDIIYYPFTQKFADLCAGCYCKVEIEVPKEIICADDFIGEIIPSGKNIRLQDVSVTITENGLRVITPSAGYDGIGQITINTEVPQVAGRLEYKEVEYTGNGEYSVRPSSGYDALSEVAISVNVPATPDRYDEGFADGEQSQKDKMVTTSVTQNGLYIREDGYSAFYVDVDNSHNEDLIANLQGDYFIIPDGTTHLRDYAFYGPCFSAITIPNSVTAIGAFAFYNNSCLQEIAIPDSVETIGNYAFNANTNLTAVTLGSGLTSIGTSTFNSCWALPEITIPASVTYIGNQAFRNDSGLTAMTFEGLVPPTLENTGTSATYGSLGQTGYTFPIYVPCAAVEDYKTAFGTAYAPRIQCIEPELATAITLNVASSITDNGQATVTVNPSGAVTDLSFSSSDTSKATIDNNGTIIVIADGTVTFCVTDSRSGLQDCETVTVTKTVVPIITAITLVVNSAITESGTATTVYEPSTVPTDIYYTSSNPTAATIASGTGVISVKANGTTTICAIDRISGLRDCKTISVYIADLSTLGMAIYSVTSTTERTEILGPEGYKSFDYMIYNGKKINIASGATGYTFSATGRQVVYYHFRDASTLKAGAFWRGTGINNLLPLVSFTLPKSVRTIQSYAFRLTALESFNLPNTVTAITDGGQVFYQCKNLTAFTFESGATIQKFTPALYNTKIKSISIPNSVKEVGDIQANLSLTAITLGTGVTKIQSAAFDNSISLVNVTIRATTPPTVTNNSSPFGSYPPQHIYVPANSVNTYKTTAPWSSLASRITAIS